MNDWQICISLLVLLGLNIVWVYIIHWCESQWSDSLKQTLWTKRFSEVNQIVTLHHCFSDWFSQWFLCEVCRVGSGRVRSVSGSAAVQTLLSWRVSDPSGFSGFFRNKFPSVLWSWWIHFGTGIISVPALISDAWRLCGKHTPLLLENQTDRGFQFRRLLF